MTISLIYWTYRMGGFDLLVEGLKHQTFKDWELIVVDDCPGRNMTKYLEDAGMPLAYCGPAKKKQYPDTPHGQCNAINTGLLHASGDTILSVTDYEWLPSDALAKWDEFCSTRPKTLFSGAGIDIRYTGEFKSGDASVFDPPFTGWSDSRFERANINSPIGVVVPSIMFGPCGPWEVFYGGAPMELFDETNGLDERADCGGALVMFVPMMQAHVLGYNFEVDPANYCYMVDHKNFAFGDPKEWYVMRKHKDSGDYKSYTWTIPAPNEFNMRDDRPRKMSGWRS